MSDRRAFLAGMIATGLCPRASWADAGNPAYLAAARLPSGVFVLFGLATDGNTLFQISLPGRGHAAAAHPKEPWAVAFARRPGTFALLIDCRNGTISTQLTAPAGHHFSGHGVFSDDGRLLFTGENDFEKGRGMIGVWAADQDYRRIRAFPSGGTGPHDLRLMPNGKSLVIANGGIETHPETGRAKLNLSTMRPNLSYLDLDGTLIEQQEPPSEWHQNSIRHLAVRPDGRVAIACQWQGDLAKAPPLLATHERGRALRFHTTQENRALRGYGGSVTFSGNGKHIALTGPRGGLAIITDTEGQYLGKVAEQDICGAAPQASGFLFTTGLGRVLRAHATEHHILKGHAHQWDNHLIPIGQ